MWSWLRGLRQNLMFALFGYTGFRLRRRFGLNLHDPVKPPDGHVTVDRNVFLMDGHDD